MSEELFARAREQREMWRRTISESQRLRAENRELFAYARWLRGCLPQKQVPLVHRRRPVHGEPGPDDQTGMHLQDW